MSKKRSYEKFCDFLVILRRQVFKISLLFQRVRLARGILFGKIARDITLTRVYCSGKLKSSLQTMTALILNSRYLLICPSIHKRNENKISDVGGAGLLQCNLHLLFPRSIIAVYCNSFGRDKQSPQFRSCVPTVISARCVNARSLII